MFVRTKYPGLIVDTTIKELKDGRLRVTGKGINPESEVEYKEIPPYTTRPVSPKRLASAKAEVVSVLEESYFNTFSAHNLGEKAAEQAFYRVVQDVENGLRLKSAWKARSTNDNVIKYFDRNIKRLVFPYLNSGNAEFSETDRELVKSKLFDICMKSSGNREDVAKEMLAKHLAEADVILAHLCDYDQSLPLIRLSSGEQVQRAWRKEQVKMLPLHVLYKFYGMLWDWAEREPRKVFFAVLVIFGLRPAEAAGCKPESIIWFDTFCVVYIQQMEADGVIVERLKNKYSFRPVVISYWGMKLLEICCVAIGEDYPRDIRPMNSATECADWVKNLLFQAGAQEKDIREIASDLSNEDLDPQSIPRQHRIEEAIKDKEVKIACYVLRRCACTIKLKAREVSAFFDDNNVTTANRELCSHFFDFLIATEKCAGKNPIITSDSKETSTNAILRAAFSQQGLGSAVFTKMFELINNRISSLYCVIVLLASGFPLQDIRNLKWKDLDFVKGFRDFVIAHIHRDYTAISKHDFSRPVIPDAALYLRKVYSSFVKERGRDKVNEEWILPRNMTNAAIAEGVNNLLVRAGFSGQTVAKGRPSKSEAIPITILRTNYQHMLNTVAGLKDDPDTFSFLCGVLLKSSTYTSYESHTTPEAQFRLYTILKSISVEKKLKEKSGVEKGKDGWLYKAVPRTNHEVARVTGTIRLRPEERIIIRVPHGVTGVVEALRKEEQ